MKSSVLQVHLCYQLPTICGIKILQLFPYVFFSLSTAITQKIKLASLLAEGNFASNGKNACSYTMLYVMERHGIYGTDGCLSLRI